MSRWGAHPASKEVSGKFPEHLQHAHVGVKELYTVHAGLWVFMVHVALVHIKLMCNNQPAISMISKLSTRSLLCCNKLFRIVAACWELRVFLAVPWVKSANHLADAPSHCPLHLVHTLLVWVAALACKFCPDLQSFDAG